MLRPEATWKVMMKEIREAVLLVEALTSGKESNFLNASRSALKTLQQGISARHHRQDGEEKEGTETTIPQKR
jgi:hypothetical protein